MIKIYGSFLLVFITLSACTSTNTSTQPKSLTAESFASTYKAQCLADPETVPGIDNVQLCNCSEMKLQESLADSSLLAKILNQPDAKEVGDLYLRIGTECANQQLKPDENSET